MGDQSSEVSVDALYREICGAVGRISDRVVRTRLVESAEFSSLYQCSLHLKMEHEQRTGSFKLRGATNKLALIAGRAAGTPREGITITDYSLKSLVISLGYVGQ